MTNPQKKPTKRRITVTLSAADSDKLREIAALAPGTTIKQLQERAARQIDVDKIADIVIEEHERRLQQQVAELRKLAGRPVGVAS